MHKLLKLELSPRPFRQTAHWSSLNIYILFFFIGEMMTRTYDTLVINSVARPNISIH